MRFWTPRSRGNGVRGAGRRLLLDRMRFDFGYGFWLRSGMRRRPRRAGIRPGRGQVMETAGPERVPFDDQLAHAGYDVSWNSICLVGTVGLELVGSTGEAAAQECPHRAVRHAELLRQRGDAVHRRPRARSGLGCGGRRPGGAIPVSGQDPVPPVAGEHERLPGREQLELHPKVGLDGHVYSRDGRVGRLALAPAALAIARPPPALPAGHLLAPVPVDAVHQRAQIDRTGGEHNLCRTPAPGAEGADRDAAGAQFDHELHAIEVEEDAPRRARIRGAGHEAPSAEGIGPLNALSII